MSVTDIGLSWSKAEIQTTSLRELLHFRSENQPLVKYACEAALEVYLSKVLVTELTTFKLFLKSGVDQN